MLQGLYDSVIRKQLVSFLIALGVHELAVLGGVLNIFVPHPILYKLQFAAGIEEVGSNGVLERVELPFIILPKNQTSSEGGLIAAPTGCRKRNQWPGSETTIRLSSKPPLR